MFNYIEKYILGGYPMVKDVFFTTKSIRLASESNKRGENDIIRNVINVNFKNSEMTHSSTYMGKQIRNDVNSMFSLGIGEYGSDWGIEVKMV